MQLKFASRYAKALIEISKEQSKLDTVYQNMQLVQATLKENSELRSLIKSPILKADKKESILQAVFGSKVDGLTMLFLKTTILKRREFYLDEICSDFVHQYNKMHKIISAKYTSATAVSQEVIEKVKSVMLEQTGAHKIEIETKINPDLIGGYVLEYDSNIVDGSILYDLRQIAKQFDDNEYVAKI